MTTPFDDLSEDFLAARSDAAGEPSWLRDRRAAALKRFLDQAWPDSRNDEYWRSTPFAKRFDVGLPIVTEAGDTATPAGLTTSLDVATALARIVDGELVEATVPAALVERGVVVMDLSAAAETHADLVRTHLGSLTTSDDEGTGGDEDRTITASDAAWTAGVFVYVPDDVELDAPVGIQVHATSPGTHLPRVLIVTGRHSRAVVYLEHSGGGIADGEDADRKTLVDEVVEVVVGESSAVDLVSLQEWSGHVAHLSLQKAAVHRGGTYRHLAVNIGGTTVRIRPEVDLVGEGASCFPLGVYFADEGQWFDMQPYIRHIAPRATSDVLYKGALQGKSRTVFRGNVLVEKDAVGTDTNETNRSLILTDGARADSTPFLEIHCADITAGHGSATGQIDARQLFYLEARGIPREQALRLMVYGFFREVLEKLDLPGVQERTLAHIDREIEAADLSRVGVGRIADVAPGEVA
ncbi:MAG: Fe-S cluster assembly protein SufD [Actinobacteria bacterium]|nr:Fe-S cluster assembly protein SufD [Actinomycetota bacterium]